MKNEKILVNGLPVGIRHEMRQDPGRQIVWASPDGNIRIPIERNRDFFIRALLLRRERFIQAGKPSALNWTNRAIWQPIFMGVRCSALWKGSRALIPTIMRMKTGITGGFSLKKRGN